MRAGAGVARSLCVLAVAALAGCAAQAPRATAPAAHSSPCGTVPTFAAGAERATLWVRTSAEYRAASESTYRAARTALELGLADPAWTAEPTQTGGLAALPPAVVMDIDETVLDNSAPQAGLLIDETCFPEFASVWDDWVAQRSAPAVPGAAEFVRAARASKDPQGRPVRVFFITNRECERRAGNESDCPQEEDTLANLRTLGLDSPTLADDLMIKGEQPDWGSEKLSRRLEVARRYRVVLNVGDDLADFLPEVRRASPRLRDEARCRADALWGRRWFVLPNPMYGSWLVALGPDAGAALAAEPRVIADCRQP
jgi:acid phosphatase